MKSQLKDNVRISISSEEIKRILIIIEAKHNEVEKTKTFVKNACEYYEITRPFKVYKDSLKRLRKQFRRRLNISKSERKAHNAKVKELSNTLNPYNKNIDEIIEDKGWSEIFIKLCEFQNFCFDEVVCYGKYEIISQNK
jgi:chromosome segregation ATPase